MRLTSNQTLLSFSLIISLLVMSQSALATNGYYTHGLGIKNKSMAGAGTASPDEAMAATVNPASAVLVKGFFRAKFFFHCTLSLILGFILCNFWCGRYNIFIFIFLPMKT